MAILETWPHKCGFGNSEMFRKYKRLRLLPTAAILLAACGRTTEAPSKATKTTEGQAIVNTIEGNKLTLDSHNGLCRITSAAGSRDLAIPWPCDFHRRTDGTIRTLRRGQTVIALVETSRPHINLPGSCNTQIQALGIAGSKVYLSEHTDTVAQCLPFLWDEQMFKGLFGDKEPGVPASR